MISRRDALKLGAGGLLGTATVSTIPTIIPAGAQTSESSNTGPIQTASIVVKWRYYTGSERAQSPTVISGTAYGSLQGEFVYALNGETGEELWRFNEDINYGLPVIEGESALVGIGPSSLVSLNIRTGEERWRFEAGSRILTPTVVDDIVFFGSENGAFYAVDVASGTELWRAYGMRFESYNPPTLAFNTTTILVSAGTPVLYAFDIATGTELWKFGTEGYRLSTPVLVDDMVYFVSEQGLVALDTTTGAEIWLHSVETSGLPALLYDDGIVYWSGLGESLHATNATTGEQVWDIPPTSPDSYGADGLLTDGTTLVFLEATGGQMFPYYNLNVVDKESGQLLWRSEDIWNHLEYSVSGDGTVIVGEWHGKAFDAPHDLYARSLSNGSEIWRWSQVGGFTSAPRFANGNIYVGGGLGTVFCLGNLAMAVLQADVTLRGAPSSTAIERGSASDGTYIESIGSQEDRGGKVWVEVGINGISGWIPFEAIDPSTLLPDGDVEYVYVPNH